MYESPIELSFIDEIYSAIIDTTEREIENKIFKAVSNYGIDVDKEELLKALQYDRGQYDRGFIDGRISRDAEIVRCKDCIHRYADGMCFGRGVPLQLVPDDGFCDKGEREKDDEK